MRSTGLATRALAVVSLTAIGLMGPVAASTAAGVRTAPKAAATPATPATPLSVTMTQLSPSTIPKKGVITISGVVRNDSKEEWTDINLAPFVSGEPITSRDALAEAAASDPSAAVGERLTEPGIAVGVPELQPGRSAPFTIRVHRKALTISGAPGVYWIGVHALGTSAEGRDLVADGRARTFIPLITHDLAKHRTVPLSVVLPLRDRARRASDGSLNGPARWVNLTKPEGRLTRLADFAASAGNEPITWLLDPAVLDALQDFGGGNPPLSLGSERRTTTQKDDGDAPDSSPSPSPNPKPVSGTPTDAQQGHANTVLQSLLSTLRTDTVLTLGYADPDVASLARRGPLLLKRAEELSSSSMQAHKLAGSPAVAPPGGYFDPTLLSRLAAGSVLLLSDHDDLTDPPSSRLPSGQEVLLTDARAEAGGPAPDAPKSPLALRQRVLAEAALEVAKGKGPVRPVVVGFPPHWDPGPDWREADFFGGLHVPWLRMTPVPRAPTQTFRGKMTYPRSELADEVPASNVAATRRLAHTSDVLGHLLANDNDVTDRLTGAALEASAYSAKPTLQLAVDQVLALDAATRSQMNRVEVTGTDFVTFSSGSGSLTVTLVNGLKQPITVGLRAQTDNPGVKVQTPAPVTMQAGQRSTILLKVTSEVGVHEVTLSPITAQGEAAGKPLTFSMRTSQVGRLIWYIIIAGGALLAVMIVRRIALRIRSNRWRVDSQ